MRCNDANVFALEILNVMMQSCFKLLSDAMIQFHTNAFAFVRKKQYKHRIIGHAKHTYPQIWIVLRFVSNRNQFDVHLKLLCSFMCIRFNKFMILMSKRYVSLWNSKRMQSPWITYIHSHWKWKMVCCSQLLMLYVHEL